MTIGKQIQKLGIKYFITKSDKDFTELYKILAPALLKFLTKYFKIPLEIKEDIIADTFVLIIEKINLYNSKYNFGTWSITIAKNIFFGKAKRNKVVYIEKYFNQIEILEEIPEYMEIPLEEVYKEINCLENPNYRYPMIDFHIKRKSIKEISENYDMNISTVKTHLRWARKKIKEKLEKKYFSYSGELV